MINTFTKCVQHILFLFKFYSLIAPKLCKDALVRIYMLFFMLAQSLVAVCLTCMTLLFYSRDAC